MEREQIEVASLQESFNKALDKSIMGTITAVLGRNVAEATLYHLYSFLGLSTEDIPTHLKEFFIALTGSFGVGGEVLGRAIVRKLYAELSLTLVQKQNCSLVEYVEDAKSIFLNGARSERLALATPSDTSGVQQ